jgi:hypothetical protein
MVRSVLLTYWRAPLVAGYNATLLRDSVASFFYFSAYEYMKKKLTNEGDTSPGVGGTLLAGGVAGMGSLQ